MCPQFAESTIAFQSKFRRAHILLLRALILFKRWDEPLWRGLPKFKPNMIRKGRFVLIRQNSEPKKWSEEKLSQAKVCGVFMRPPLCLTCTKKCSPVPKIGTILLDFDYKFKIYLCLKSHGSFQSFKIDFQNLHPFRVKLTKKSGFL